MTQQYVGTKQVMAWPQLGGPKVSICGRDCHPDDGTCNGYCSGEVGRPPEVAQVDGYAVKYSDGYISWSPKEVFEAAYIPLGNIDHLPAHVQRVVAERAQLADKLAKLNKFLGGDHSAQLPAADRELLQLQAHQMGQYLRTLDLRLERMQ